MSDNNYLSDGGFTEGDKINLFGTDSRVTVNVASLEQVKLLELRVNKLTYYVLAQAVVNFILLFAIVLALFN